VHPIEFTTERLTLRVWRESDRDPFAAMNADPRVMEFFPTILTRSSSDAIIDASLEAFAWRGFSQWAVELRNTRQFIGFVGLSSPRHVLPFSPCIEIGWRLAHEFWGQGYATEPASETLRVGFEQMALAEIVSFTSLLNRRSRAVMERIGLVNSGQDFDHPGVPETSPLRRHCLYRLSREEWQSRQSFGMGPESR
jgi:RimJ/RimL family protein N-acetyltransferase